MEKFTEAKGALERLGAQGKFTFRWNSMWKRYLMSKQLYGGKI